MFNRSFLDLASPRSTHNTPGTTFHTPSDQIVPAIATGESSLGEPSLGQLSLGEPSIGGPYIGGGKFFALLNLSMTYNKHLYLKPFKFI